MVGRQALVLLVGVRILLSQPALERQSCCLLWRIRLMPLQAGFDSSRLHQTQLDRGSCLQSRSVIQTRLRLMNGELAQFAQRDPPPPEVLAANHQHLKSVW